MWLISLLPIIEYARAAEINYVLICFEEMKMTKSWKLTANEPLFDVITERQLEGCDIALPLPVNNARSHGLGRGTGIRSSTVNAGGQARMFRFLLLTPDDVPARQEEGSSLTAMATTAIAPVGNTVTVIGTVNTSDNHLGPSSPSTGEDPVVVQTRARLQARLSRLLSLTGGVDVGVIFLLHCEHQREGTVDAGVEPRRRDGGMEVLMQLQVL